jgi:two-component system LytT family response regulator
VSLLPAKVVMADDEHGVMLLLCSILSRLEGALVIGTAENAKDTIKLTIEHNPDLAFLDIELPDMKGIELAEKLREIKPDLAIVFITAHQEYSLNAFKLYAFDYILKPIDEERINLGNERVFIKLNEIFYIEKSGRHTLISCTNGKFKTRQTLQELEKYLGKMFFRSHKSFIINTDRIEKVLSFPNSSYYEVKFNNCEDKALLSRDRMSELMKYSDYNV